MYGYRRVFVAVLVLALAARLATAVMLGDQVRGLSGAADERTYSMLAQRVASGHGLSFPTRWYPYVDPDTPSSYFSAATGILYGAVYVLFGAHPLAARLLAAGLGTLSVAVLMAIARNLFGDRVALLAGGVAAVYAYLVFYSASITTEAPFTLAVLGLVLAAYMARSRRTWGAVVALGVAAGAAVLFRLAIVFYVPVLLLWVWRGTRLGQVPGGLGGSGGSGGSGELGRGAPPRWVWLVVPLAIVGIMLAPTTVRNWRLWGEFVPSETQFGHVFWNGNHPDQAGSFHSFEVFPVPAEVLALENEAMRTRALLRLGVANVAADPAHFLNLTGDRLMELYKFWPTRESTPVANALRLLSFTLVVPLALAGMWLSRRRWRDLVPIYALVVIHTLVYAVSWTMVRYRVPLDPFFIMFAAVAMDRILARWRPPSALELESIRKSAP